MDITQSIIDETASQIEKSIENKKMENEKKAVMALDPETINSISKEIENLCLGSIKSVAPPASQAGREAVGGKRWSAPRDSLIGVEEEAPERLLSEKTIFPPKEDRVFPSIYLLNELCSNLLEIESGTMDGCQPEKDKLNYLLSWLEGALDLKVKKGPFKTLAKSQLIEDLMKEIARIQHDLWLELTDKTKAGRNNSCSALWCRSALWAKDINAFLNEDKIAELRGRMKLLDLPLSLIDNSHHLCIDNDKDLASLAERVHIKARVQATNEWGPDIYHFLPNSESEKEEFAKKIDEWVNESSCQLTCADAFTLGSVNHELGVYSNILLKENETLKLLEKMVKRMLFSEKKGISSLVESFQDARGQTTLHLEDNHGMLREARRVQKMRLYSLISSLSLLKFFQTFFLSAYVNFDNVFEQVEKTILPSINFSEEEREILSCALAEMTSTARKSRAVEETLAKLCERVSVKTTSTDESLLTLPNEQNLAEFIKTLIKIIFECISIDNVDGAIHQGPTMKTPSPPSTPK